MPKKDAELSRLPSLDTYVTQIDFDQITAAIHGPEGTPKIAEYDLEDVKRMVWVAAEKWLPRDIYDFHIEGVEETYEQPFGVDGLNDPIRVKGIIDLYGTLNGRLNVTKRFAGLRTVVDWKTTHQTLDKDWEERLLDSWQWKKYLHFKDADVMIYRGINRDGKTRELLIERPAGLSRVVRNQITGIALEREAVSGLDVWPMRMPGSCGAFGRECPWWTNCRTSTQIIGIYPADKSLSYSSMDKFMLCPERHRADVVCGVQEDTEESLFGQAFHRGIAELYQQVKERIQE